MEKKKNIGIVFATLFSFSIIAFPVTQISANTVDKSDSNVITVSDEYGSVRYISNAEILNAFKTYDPVGYAKIPKADIENLLRQDMLRAGTTKVVNRGNGVSRIYVNSAIVKVMKYGTGGLGILLSPIAPWAGAVVSFAALGMSEIDSSRGIWFDVRETYNGFGLTYNWGYQ